MHHSSIDFPTKPVFHPSYANLGNSYTDHEQLYRENTLESLMHAGASGADMVECDVQLTKDGIPIVYHDFNLKVNLRKRVG